MIISVSNSIVTEVMCLREPKGRRENGLTLIEGAKEIKHAIDAKVDIRKVIYSSGFMAGRNGKNIWGPKVEQVEVADRVFQKLAYGRQEDGVIAIARVSALKLADLRLSANPLLVLIEAVEKPGNLGAIMRTCDGAGVSALIICDPKTDIYNPNVIRASVGTVFTVPLATTSNEQAHAFLKAQGIKTVGAFPDAKHAYTAVPLKGSLCIVLGTEDQGLSPFWRQSCHAKVKIPMNGKADSLNVSVSAAIIIYEALRQRT